MSDVANLNYLHIYIRCKVPSCDDGSTSDNLEYETDWLHFAVPFKADGKPEACQRFQSLADNDETLDPVQSRCHESAFNQSVIETCDEFVFVPGELTIVNEV